MSEILSERRMADLYHTTTLNSLQKIIKSNAILPSKNGWVSLTRDPRYEITQGHNTVKIVIDQAKLSQSHRLEPYDFDQDLDYENHDDAWFRNPDMRRAESEERTQRPIPLKYVKAVIMGQSNNPSVIRSEIEQLRKEEGEHADNEFSLTSSYMFALKKSLAVEKALRGLGIQVIYDHLSRK